MDISMTIQQEDFYEMQNYTKLELAPQRFEDLLLAEH